MAIKTRDLTRDWRRGDAERLARLFNDASEGWPGGAWDPETPEEVERNVREQPLLGAFVTDEGDHFASFCSLYAKPGEKNRAYVPLLTALPAYHGKGYGKAVLHRSVERVYELGIARVDLHTWPGNLKAVPLYKKTGFMWAPDMPWGVLMQNFTTGARRHPAAQTFFRQHDWYATMKRNLALEPDDHKRGKVRVYPYEWEEDGDRLRMVYDRQSWGLVELETNEFLVACFLEDEKLVAGLPQRVRWQIVNHTGKPLEVALIATADEGIALDHKEFLQVRTKAEAGAEFTVSPDIAEKEKEPRAPIIHTELLINGTPISLAAGFEVKQPVSVNVDREAIGLRPGRDERVTLQVWSDLDKPAEAKLRLSASAGVSLGVAEATVRIPAKGSQEVALPLRVAEAGLAEVKAEAEVQYGGLTLKPKAETLRMHALLPGDMTGHVEKRRAVIETAVMRLAANRQGGWTEVFDKIRNRRLAQIHAPLLGPPMAWDEFDERGEARIERRGDRISLVLTTDSIHRPGVRLERRLTLSNLPLVEVVDTIINGGATELKVRVQTRGALEGNGGAMLAMTRQGLVRGSQHAVGRQLPEHNLGDEGAEWPEGWAAVEDETGAVTGFLWDAAARVEWHGRWARFDRVLPPVPPGESAALPATYFYAGEGTALAVRRWWQMLYGPQEIRDQRLPETREPLEFGLEPQPLVVHGDQAEAKLMVDAVGRLQLSGTLTVTGPPEVEVQPGQLEFDQVCEGRPASEPVKVRARKGTAEGAYTVESTLALDRVSYRRRRPVLVLGNPKQPVTVKKVGKQSDVLRIESGALALTVAPEFRGTAISLTRGKEELLRSAYPEARPLAWSNPWYGGITPELSSLGRDLMKERFTARIIERRGAQGIAWKGVRMSCSPKEDRGRHDKLELDYLLAPGSEVVAVAIRLHRRTDTAGWLEGSLSLWPVLGGSFLDATLSSSDDACATLRRTEFGRGLSARRWVIAKHPEQAHAVLFACGDGDTRCFAQVFGQEGYYLGGERWATLEARETKESIFYFSFTDKARARELAEALADLKGLP